MRSGKWELHVLVDGEPQHEHDVEGHTCVEARPGAHFAVKVVYHGSEMHVVELLIDGQPVSARYQIDGSGQTSRGTRSVTLDAWEKSRYGNVVKTAFVYEQTRTQDDANGAGPDNAGCGLASAPVDWSRGVISFRVYRAHPQVLAHDCHSASHDPVMKRADALSEKAMVKGGCSTSAGFGEKSFASQFMWRAGMTYAACTPGDPPETELRVYYRDSFFLLLKGDESKVHDTTSEAECSAGVAEVRKNVRRITETTQRLAKRHHAAVIDLTDD